MIEIRITADSFTEAQKQIRSFFHIEAPVNYTGSTSEAYSSDDRVETTSTPQKKTKKKRSKKSTTQTVTASSEPTEAAATKSAPKEVKAEDVYKALQTVSAEKGLARAREVLQEFGCDRISVLKPDQYSEFVAACEKVCQG